MRKPEKLGKSEKEEGGKRFKKFKDFLENKIILKKRGEGKQLEDIDYRPPLSLEEERKYDFEKYLKGLNLNLEDLRGKRILDLGCGPGGFVKECTDRGLAEVYGLDLNIDPEKLEEKYKNHFLKGDFKEELPLKDLDLIVSHGAVGPGRDREQDLIKIITRALESIKEDGEIRISPIHKVLYRAPGTDCHKSAEFERKKWQEALDHLSSKGLINYELRPIRIGNVFNEIGDEPDIWLTEVLVLKKGVEVSEGEGENTRQLDEARSEAEEAFEEGEKG